MNTVFIDVDTQLDFLCPAGALYVAGAESIVDTVARLNHAAATRRIPLLSTADAHAEDDPEFRTWPGHCIRGTLGQRKPAATLLEQPLVVPCSGKFRGPAAAKQFIVEKTALDAFTNPNLPDLLKALDARRYIVYGVVMEICVALAAHGLLSLPGSRVEIVTDAVRHLDKKNRDSAFSDLLARGGVLTTSAALLGSI